MTTMTLQDLDSGHGVAARAFRGRDANDSGQDRFSPVPGWNQQGVLGVVLTWVQRSRQRSQLAELDDRQLADIGITRVQAQEEANKPFWLP